MDQSKESQKLFFNRKAEEREFKILALVEDTILGILEIIERVFRTLSIILFKPDKLRKLLTLPFRETVLIGPFTFLTFSSFLSSLVLSADIFDDDGLSSRIAEELSQLSVFSVVKLAFPLLLTKILLAILLSALIAARKGSEYRNTTFKLLCYWFGMIFLVFGIATFLFLLFFLRMDELADQFDGIFAIGSVVVFLYSSLRLGNISFERFRPTRMKSLNMIFRGLLSMLCSLLVFTITTVIAVEENRIVAWTLENKSEIFEELSVYTSQMEMTESGKTKITLMVKNDSKNLTYVKKNYKMLTLTVSYLKCDEDDKCKSINAEETFQYFIHNWEAGDGHLMAIAAGETKWMEIMLDEVDLRTKRSEEAFDKISIKELTLRTLLPQPYRDDEDYNTIPRTFESSDWISMNSIIWER